LTAGAYASPWTQMRCSRSCSSLTLFEQTEDRCPHLFAERPVFIPQTQRERMAPVIRAVTATACRCGHDLNVASVTNE
jgi:hypothetical protein